MKQTQGSEVCFVGSLLFRRCGHCCLKVSFRFPWTFIPHV